MNTPSLLRSTPPWQGETILHSHFKITKSSRRKILRLLNIIAISVGPGISGATKSFID